MELKMNRSLNRKSYAIQKRHGIGHPNDSFRFIQRQQDITFPISQVYLNGRTIKADQLHENDGSMATLMQILVFCNENTNKNRIQGTPDLEKSLLDFAAAKGFHKKLFDKIVPKIAEVRIDSVPGKASVIIGLNGLYRLVIKDKPEQLLDRCDLFLFKGRTTPLTMNMFARIKNVYQQMVLDDCQVIMLAFKDLERLPEKLDPVFQTNSLTLVGMIGLRLPEPDNPDSDLEIRKQNRF